MNEFNAPQKNILCILFFFFLISLGVMILTLPLHEALHWIMSEIDPYVKPMEFHLFDGKSQSFSIGYILIKEEYSGSFKDRPLWADTLQELICCFIQIIISTIICIKIFSV